MINTLLSHLDTNICASDWKILCDCVICYRSPSRGEKHPDKGSNQLLGRSTHLKVTP